MSKRQSKWSHKEKVKAFTILHTHTAFPIMEWHLAILYGRDCATYATRQRSMIILCTVYSFAAERLSYIDVRRFALVLELEHKRQHEQYGR
jgi:hypothetical protein